MLYNHPFDAPAAAKRRAAEPDWRRFPSLWETFPAPKAGFLDGLAQLHTGARKAVSFALASSALDKFFAERAPHLLYPYVWVRNALNPVPDSSGMHNWVHEVLVSYEPADMPDEAPIKFNHGQLEKSPTPPDLKFGATRRYDARRTDLVRAYCAYAHIGPAQRAAEHEEGPEVEPSDSPAP